MPVMRYGVGVQGKAAAQNKARNQSLRAKEHFMNQKQLIEKKLERFAGEIAYKELNIENEKRYATQMQKK